MWVILIIFAFLGTWLFGFILDKYVRYQTAYYKVANDRVPQITELIERVKDIQDRLSKLEEIKRGGTGN